MDPVKNPAPQAVDATVLVVEDGILSRLALAEHFRRTGVRVIEAINGEEALSILTAVQAVDLVITDVHMPGSIDGITLAQRVKQDYQLPVILMSGQHADAPPNGIADAFFAKPYELDKLLAAASTLLNRSAS